MDRTEDAYFFLKTIIPSRNATRDYLHQGDADALPVDTSREAFDDLLKVPGLRIERIVSHGISSITLAGLLHGAEKSSRVSENLSVIEDFCSRLAVLPYGIKAAQHYGAIRAALEKQGHPIGVNDLHIAGHARSEGLVLVTNSVSEFERVPALEVENWIGA